MPVKEVSSLCLSVRLLSTSYRQLQPNVVRIGTEHRVMASSRPRSSLSLSLAHNNPHCSATFSPSIAISLSVSLSVRRHISKTTSTFHEMFVRVLHVTVARSSADDNAIRYVLPVWEMTSCFHIREQMGENQRLRVCFVQVAAPATLCSRLRQMAAPVQSLPCPAPSCSLSKFCSVGQFFLLSLFREPAVPRVATHRCRKHSAYTKRRRMTYLYGVRRRFCSLRLSHSDLTVNV